MTWSADPELQQMFLGELDERSSRLLEGAHAMRTDAVTKEMAGAMMREGHTVKGTSRVMGYYAVSVAGHLVEHIWRGIQKAEREPGMELARALEMAARAIPDAGRADPEIPTRDLAEAMAWLAELTPDFDMPDLPEPAPEPEAKPAPAVESVPVEPDPVEEAVSEPHDADEPHGTGDVGSAEAHATVVEEVPAEADHDEPIEPEPEAPTPEPVQEETPPLTLIVDNDDEPDGGFADDERPILVPIEGSPEVDGRRRGRSKPEGELGFLVTAVERWAGEHTMMVNAGRLFELMNLIAELRLEAETMANRVQRTLANPEASRAGARRSVDAVRAMTESLQVQALAMSSTPFHHLTSQLPQVANYLSGKLSRQVQLEVVADEDLAVDREVIDHLTEAVRQLVVNAVYHGIEDPSDRARADKPEMGTVTVTATLKDRMLDITVSDDGAGIDWDLVRAIAVEDGRLQGDAPMQAVRNVVFEAGFSTQTGGDAVGEGMGLETVARAVESLYGRVVIESTAGRGTQLRITVPAWRSLQRLLVVEAGGVGWGIPEAAVDEVMPYADVVVGDESSDLSIPWRGERIAVRPLGTLMGAEATVDPSHVVVLRHRLGSTALAVDLIDGVREVAVKELSPVVSSPDHVTGAAFLGGDDVVLVLDPGSLVAGGSASASDRPAPRVLVVDDSMGARAVVSGSLASSGFTTSVAASVAEALEVLEHIELDALVVDYSMPGTDGVALVQEVRQRYERLPIVMLSGVADEADRERARTAGVNAFFDKGAFREGELSDALWGMVGGQ